MLKRFLDLLISFAGLLILSPVFLIVPLLIRLSSKGPVFFKQERVGKDGETFEVLKFRSMKVDKEAEESFNFGKDAQRVTTIGKFIRRTKIDELPQILNILRGDMSIVGPRPTIVEQVKQYTPYQKQRLRVRPGLTGLAQVNGNIHLTWEERIEYDLEYIRKQSLWLDIKIILKTIGVVLFGEEKFTKQRQRVSGDK